jgi:hypothetical protein
MTYCRPSPHAIPPPHAAGRLGADNAGIGVHWMAGEHAQGRYRMASRARQVSVVAEGCAGVLTESPMMERGQVLKVHSVLIKGRASREDIRCAVEEAVARMRG